MTSLSVRTISGAMAAFSVACSASPPVEPITVSIDPRGAPLELGDMQFAVEGAVAYWRDRGYDLEAVPERGTSQIYFEHRSGDYEAGHAWQNGDVRINSWMPWSVLSCEPGTAFFDHVVTHELGHVLGLVHSDDPSDVMYWRFVGCATPVPRRRRP